ncbi:DUF2461 domain-containing protein [Sciscionella sediminilitoris]|uniref:DUF2461 domain-containing protein n=1 Tax=Sciscionella sediminilitoris TaxID=1445613 RepID=UPI0004DF28DD|nr:DUF2461 domain-containing protein [Sciscionella sp. SE31]
MRFEGFGEHAVEYYDGLLADNSKAYYEDNKQIYLEQVRAPMEALLAELEPEFSEFGSGKVFRPYRDLRFAKDKTPYKTQCGAVIERGRGGGALYVQLSSEGLLAAVGCYHTETDQLARLRAALDEDRRGGELQDLTDRLVRKGWELRGDQMKTKPRGVSPEHPRLELLRYRTLYVARSWEPDDMLHDRGLLRRVRDAWRQARPLGTWFLDHVGGG